MCTLYERVKRYRFIASSFAVHFIARSRVQNTLDFSGQLLYAGTEYNIISLLVPYSIRSEIFIVLELRGFFLALYKGIFD